MNACIHDLTYMLYKACRLLESNGLLNEEHPWVPADLREWWEDYKAKDQERAHD